MKKIVFSKLWKHDTYYEVESIRLQKNKFGRVYMFIKSEAIMKETFKDWKAFWTSISKKKSWSFLTNRIRRPIIKKQWAININKS
jgi:hypothetical protein